MTGLPNRRWIIGQCEALYAAKQSGRNRVAVADASPAGVVATREAATPAEAGRAAEAPKRPRDTVGRRPRATESAR